MKVTFKRIFFSILLLFILLFCFVYGVLRVPYVQNLVVNEITSFISQKTKSDVRIGYISLSFPKALVLEDVLFRTPEDKTLFSSQKIEIDIDSKTLSLEEIILDEIYISDLNANISVNKSGQFNFDYIINSFSSETDEQVLEDTTTSILPNIILNDIHLENAKITYLDSVLNLKTNINIGYLRTYIPLIDLNNSTYNIESLDLNNSKVNYTQFGVMPVSDKDTIITEEATPFILNLSHSNISNFIFQYHELNLGENAYIEIGNFEIVNHIFNLEETTIELDNTSLGNTKIEYSFVSDTTNIPIYHKPTLKRINSLDIGWDIIINNISVNNLDLKYDDNLYTSVPIGIDPNHIYIQKINTSINDLKINDDIINIDITKFGLQEKSGLSINDFNSKIHVTPNELSLKNMLLEWNNSFIQNDLYLSYPNLFQIGDYPEKLYFDNTLHKAHFSFKDLVLFDPTLENDTLIASFLKHDIVLKSHISGDLNQLKIDESEVSSSLGIQSKFGMELSNVLVEDSLNFNLNIDSLNFYTIPLTNIFLDSTLIDEFNIPQTIQGDIYVSGDLNNIQSKSQINLINYGFFTLDFDLKNQDEYSIQTKTYDLKVGEILKDSTIGKISTDLSFIGKGFDIDNDLKAKLSFELTKGEYNHYDYKGLAMDMSIDRKSAIWKASADKEGFQFELNGDVNMNSEIPTATINGQINEIDLNRINFYEDTLSFGMSIDSKTKGFDLLDLNSTLDIKDIFIIEGKEKHEFKFIKSHLELDSTHFFFDLESEEITAHTKSDVAIDSISTIIERYFSQFLSSRKMIGKLPPSNGTLEGYIKVNNSDLLTNGNIPGLDSLVFETCAFKFDASLSTFDFDLLIPKITYTDYDIDTIYLNVHANSEKMKYDLGFNQFHMIGYEDYSLHNWTLYGEAKDNNLIFKTEGYDIEKENKWLYIGGDLNLDSTTYKFSLEDEIIINKEKWNVDHDNYILSDGGLPYIHNLYIKKGKQSFTLESSQFNEQDTVYSLAIDQFSLDSATYNTLNDTSAINGEINALVKIGNLYEGGALSAKLNIDGLGFLNNILADIKSTSSNTDNINIYQNTTQIEGEIGEIKSYSTFNISDSIAPLDLSIEINNLLLKPFEIFAKGYASDFSGALDGKMKISGLGTDPLKVEGQINMLAPRFKVDLLNVYLNGTKGFMLFDNKGIHFQQFGFTDEEGHLAILSGDIETDNYEDFNFDLKFSADDITLINSTSKDNPEYFGKLIIGNLTKIQGPIDHLLIDSKIRISRGTDLTYVYIDGGVGDIDNGEDIIKFIEKNDTTKVVSKSDNYEIKATINIDQNSIFKIVIDPRAGDALTLVGGGTLNLRMDAGDDMVMSGQYTITEGDYSMTFYQLMNKKLKLAKGSNVLWTGDPYNPQADMTAIYEESTSPYPLVANQLQNSQAEANKYKSKRKFIVYMNMNGDVIKPDLSFKLEYPEGSQGGDKIETAVENLNQDPSQLNKQVFAFLILGTFLNDAGGEGANTTDMVAGSVSSIISQQLNNVTDGLTNGFVDVNFDLDSYSQTQESGTSNRTDVGVTLKKTLFNDRLSVSVGGKMAVNGNQANNNNNNSFNTDFLLEYNLLTDGTLKNRLFRSVDAQYFTPDVFKTGVSIMFTKEYNQGKELFIRNLDKKKDIRKRMGMIKRSNTGGGMMKSSGMKSASSPNTPDSLSNTQIDSTQIKSDSTSTTNELKSDSIKTITPDTNSNSPMGQTPINDSSIINLFLPHTKNELTIKSLANNE